MKGCYNHVVVSTVHVVIDFLNFIKHMFVKHLGFVNFR
jgi:hypothetical protein